jgi:lipopolysaccharide export system protein LptC
MTVTGVSVNLQERTMQGDDGVEGAVPAGTFSADTIRADLDARTIKLEGNARLTMIPGKLRVP